MLGSKPRTQQQAVLNIHRASMMNKFFSWVLMLFSYLIFTNSSFAAPPTIEIFSGSGSGQGPTASSGTHTFLLNRNNPSDNTNETYAPITTVSYTITNSTYNTAVYSGQGSTANKPELTFGAGGNASSVTASNILQPLNQLVGLQVICLLHAYSKCPNRL